MKKNFLLFLVGLGAGAIDLIPLLLVQAPPFNLLAVLAFWLCTSFFVYKTRLFSRPAPNGLVVSILMMLPMALAVSASNPKDFFPMMLMAVLLGPLVGILVHKVHEI